MTENSSEQPKLSKAKGCLRIIGITVYSIIYIPLIIVGMVVLMGERLGVRGPFEAVPAMFWLLVAINPVLLFFWEKIRTKIDKWPLIIGYCIIFIGYPSYYALSYDPYGAKAVSNECTSNGAKKFAVQRVEDTIGDVFSLDLWNSQENKWVFHGSAYSNRVNDYVTVTVVVSCRKGKYEVEDVDIDF